MLFTLVSLKQFTNLKVRIIVPLHKRLMKPIPKIRRRRKQTLRKLAVNYASQTNRMIFGKTISRYISTLGLTVTRR
jgi:hypothetical protein